MSSAKQERTKVVVRNLPPTLTEESFHAAVDKVAEGRYDWMAYYPGKISLKRTLHSRGYLNLLTPADVLAFKERFDGHVFVSSKGSQYRCSVEYAPFQRVPKTAAKKPAVEGTIESDPAYQAFLKRLEEGPQSLPSATAQLEAREAEGRAAADGSERKAVVVTPLMEYLRNKYAGGAPPRRGAKGRARPVQRLEVVEELVGASQTPEPPQPVDAKSKKGRAAKAAVAGKGVGADGGQAVTGPALFQASAKQGPGSKKEARQQQDGASTHPSTKGGRHAGAAAAKPGGRSAGEARDAADQGGRPARAPKQAAAEQQPSRQGAPAQVPSPSGKGSGKARPGSAAASTAGTRQDGSAAAAAAAATMATATLLSRPSSSAAPATGLPAPARGAAAAAAQAASTALGAEASTDAGSAARRPRAVAAGGPRNRLFASALQKAAGGPAGGKAASSRQQAGSDDKSGQG